MSITENESSVIKECLKQLKACSEFLSSSCDEIGCELKKIKIETNDNTRDFDKIKRNLKKVYKEAKQKIHDIGKNLRDSEEISLHASSVAEKKVSSETDKIRTTSIDTSPIENGCSSKDILEEVRSSEVVDQTKHPDKISIPNEIKQEDGLRNKIRLVAIEKLLDPKVIVPNKSNNQLYNNSAAFNSSGIIVLDSDDEEPQITKQPKEIAEPEKSLPRPKPLPKLKRLKIPVKRCRIPKEVLRAANQSIKISEMVPRSRRHSSSSSTVERRKNLDKDDASSNSSKSHSTERKKRNDDHKSSSRKSNQTDRDNGKVSSRRSEKRTKSQRNGSNKSSDEEKQNKKQKRDKRYMPGTSSSTNRYDSASDDEMENSKKHSKKHKSKENDKTKQIDAESEKSDSDKSNTSKTKDESDENSSDERISKKKRSETPDEQYTKSDDNSESSANVKNERTKRKNAELSDEKNNKKMPSGESSDDEQVLKPRKKKDRRISISSESKVEDDRDDKSNQSSDEEEIFNKKKIHSKRKRILTSSCSETSANDNDDDDDDDEDDIVSESDDDEKKKKKSKRRVKCGSDDSDNETPTKRKNIRKVIKTKNLDGDTKKATEAEKERRKRLEERQKLYNQIFEKPESVQVDKMVLDFDEETKEELLSVDKGLLKKLKPHQVTGVKFMWDSCYETLKDIKNKPGSGCILGHCMGLGKTLQIVTLTHTLLINGEKTGVSTVLVITPLSTVTNWAREYQTWLKYCKKKNIDIYDMSKFKDKRTRLYKLKEWQEDGGVCILGYDMYRILANPKSAGGKKMRESLQSCLVDPGPDLIVCDEGHLLKNEKTSISQAVSRVRTQRRIVLSGTPLQNNLKEYYCMIQFVKPNLLGTYKEYLNRFVNPITNGQYTDSTDHDIRLMKNRSHVLHKMLEGCIQRRDYSVLAPYLPPKHEYVIFIALSDLQKQLYEYYMTTQRTSQANGKGTALFNDFQNLRRIWTHPMTLKINSILAKKKRERKMLAEDDENSMDDFIDYGSGTSEESEAESTSESDDSSNSAKRKKHKKKAATSRRTRQNNDQLSEEEEVQNVEEVVETEWWMSICPENEMNKIQHSPKLLLLFELLQEAESIGDKTLLFSQSLQSLDVIEKFLSLIDNKTRGSDEECDVNGFIGSWSLGKDYFRLDGSHSVESRELMCKRFNDSTDYRSRLFLISTRAGSLGINLVAANRVIIFDASWNPSHDTQSIFRVYRFGQNKPCYIYRFIAKGTMEEKVYERQVTKQATAKRVIDEQQIGRHYNQSDLLELYQYELGIPEVREVPILPKDRLFADLLKKHDKLIINYHEHDSLLENKESEHLSEEERKAAWSEYEAEKDRPAQIQQPYMAYARPNYRNGPVTSSKIFGFRTDVLLQVLNLKVKRDHPQLNDGQVGQLVPHYLRQLYEEMNVGTTNLHSELVDLSLVLGVPSGYYVNPVASNYILNPFSQPQQTDPSYIHEID